MSHRLSLALAALMFTATAQSEPILDFSFTFTNKWNGAGTGVVTGIVRGLIDNTTSAATSVEILSNSDGYGLGEYGSTPIFNTWTLANGVLTDFFFLSEGEDNVAPGVTSASLVLDGSPITDIQAGLTNDPGFTRRGSDTDLTFTLVPPTPIPVPATAFLVVGALAALGVQRARVKAG